MLDALLNQPEAQNAPPPTSSPLGASLLLMAADALPTAMLVLDGSDEHGAAANRAFRGLWKTSVSPSLSEVHDRICDLAADPATASDLWATRRSLLEPAEPAFLLLRDGRQIKWTSRRIDGGVLHLFEETAPVPLSAPGADDLFRLTFEKAAIGMTLISADFRFLRANPSFCAMVRFNEAELRERRLFDLLHPDEAGRAGEMIGALISGQETLHAEQRFLSREAETVWGETSLSVVRDGDGRATFFVGLVENITQRKRAAEETDRRTRELQALASTDPLTGLYNHRFMQEALSQHLSEAAKMGQPMSVMMLDIDHFRQLNEAHGHDAGNRALAAVADCVRGAMREQDYACRFGGDEMAGILVGASHGAALAAAERIRQRVAAIRPIAAHTSPITCSIGVASFPVHASTAESLLKAADVALYQAKHDGRDRVCGFVPSPAGEGAGSFDALQSTMQGASLEAVNALVTAIDLRDRYTGAHCQRVGRLSVDLGRRLGCTEAEIEILRLGAPLLDVGKIGLPDYLLTKTDTLTRTEWDTMRQHPVWGEELVRRTALPTEILELVRWHHERLDGSGYPDALQGDQIPTLVRIVNVADVATALREDRPHRRAWPRERVQDYLRRQAGLKLDLRVVQAYVELFSAR